MAVGLVVALGRRRVAVARSRSSPNTAFSSRRRCGFWIVASSSRRSRSIWSSSRAGPSCRSGGRTRPLAPRGGSATVRRGARERAGHEHDRRPAGRGSPARSAVGQRRHAPGPVAEDQLELVATHRRPRATSSAWETSVPSANSRTLIPGEDKVACGQHRNGTPRDRHRRNRRARLRGRRRGCSTTAGAWSCPGSSSASSSGSRARDGLELVQADLFDADAVARRGGAGGRRGRDAPLRGVVNLVGGFADGRPRARDADRGVRAAVPAEPAARRTW